MAICTTLNSIRAHGPCAGGWAKLLKGLGKTEADDEPLPLAAIVQINGLEDALWATRALPAHDREWRLFAVWCARRVQHLMLDPRSVAAVDVAERYALGTATEGELGRARYAAMVAWYTAGAARDAAQAAWAAAMAARGAAQAAWGAAWAAEREAQTQEFLRVVGGTPCSA